MRTIRFEDKAAEEIDDITRYLDERSGSAADRFELELGEVVRNSLENPGMYRRIESLPEADVRKARLKTFPYSVVYRIEKTEVVIAAVSHTSRHPAHWRNRVSK